MSDEAAEFHEQDAKLASLAAKHIMPEHIDRALSHYAEHLQKRIKKMSKEHVNAMQDHEHEAAFAAIAEANPKVARPKPKPAALKTVPRPRY